MQGLFENLGVITIEVRVVDLKLLDFLVVEEELIFVSL